MKNWKIVRRIRFGCACYKIVRDYCRAIAGRDPEDVRNIARHSFRSILRADTEINYNGGPSILP